MRTKPPEYRRAGETLLECVFAAALALAIFLPAAAAVRQALQCSGSAERTALQACRTRTVLNNAVTASRLGKRLPEYQSVPADGAPVLLRTKPPEGEETGAEETVFFPLQILVTHQQAAFFALSFPPLDYNAAGHPSH